LRRVEALFSAPSGLGSSFHLQRNESPLEKHQVFKQGLTQTALKELTMDKLQIEWGNLDRTEAIETDVFAKAEKILSFAPDATNLIVRFQVVNPKTSAGPSTQKVSMELRLPQNRDVRSEKEGSDLYRSLKDTEQAILTQLESKKRH
jgi:ribosome-associated translation inhibitor RaiA